MNGRRVEHDADELPMAEGIVVGTELIGVSSQGGRRGDIFHVVIACDIMDPLGIRRKVSASECVICGIGIWWFNV